MRTLNELIKDTYIDISLRIHFSSTGKFYHSFFLNVNNKKDLDNDVPWSSCISTFSSG